MSLGEHATARSFCVGFHVQRRLLRAAIDAAPSEAAGVAASLAIQSDLAVQRVDYAALRPKLRDLGAKLDRPSGTDKAKI